MIILLSLSELGTLCREDKSVTSLSMSKLLRSGAIVPSALAIRVMHVSVLLAPRPLIAVLQSRFKCSQWRSFGIFLPG